MPSPGSYALTSTWLGSVAGPHASVSRAILAVRHCSQGGKAADSRPRAVTEPPSICTRRPDTCGRSSPDGCGTIDAADRSPGDALCLPECCRCAFMHDDMSGSFGCSNRPEPRHWPRHVRYDLRCKGMSGLIIFGAAQYSRNRAEGPPGAIAPWSC